MMKSSSMTPFADDPFFSDISSEMQRMDRHFENLFGDFGRMRGFESALDYSGREREGRASGQERRNSDTLSNRAVQPFGNWMADPFSMMNSMMRNMEQVMQHQTADPNSDGNVFSSSSFYSYSSDGRSAPRVVEAHKAERRAPGGARETRRAYRDSETGVARMAVGHHLDDRAHIIERSENRITGQREQRNEFHGIEEADAEHFNREWQERVRGTSLGPQDRRLARGNDVRDRTIEYKSNDQSERRRK